MIARDTSSGTPRCVDVTAVTSLQRLNPSPAAYQTTKPVPVCASCFVWDEGWRVGVECFAAEERGRLHLPDEHQDDADQERAAADEEHAADAPVRRERYGPARVARTDV